MKDVAFVFWWAVVVENVCVRTGIPSHPTCTFMQLHRTLRWFNERNILSTISLAKFVMGSEERWHE
jgi:hypothetical protein